MAAISTSACAVLALTTVRSGYRVMCGARAASVLGDRPSQPNWLTVGGISGAALLPLSHSLADLAARSAPAARVAAAHAAAEDLTALCLRHPAPMGAAYTAKPVFPTSGAK